MTKTPFYITTTLPYANGEPHIGFAMELVRADIIARAAKISGRQVFLNTGTDEHGVKIFQKAGQMHKDPQAYVDEISAVFKELLPALGIAVNEPGITFNFIRTSDPRHIEAAGEFWKAADRNGLIYKKNYKIRYCVGCELEKTESELVDGKCPLHPLMGLEIYEEENYFFRFSLYQKPLMDLYEKDPSFVIPNSRLNEIRAFVERGLEDFSVSRLASKMPWGIPVPGDKDHVMYVWFDALANYVTAVGWPNEMEKFRKWWIESGGAVQYCGKDNLRQQSAMWQAMLMAVKLPPSKQIIINGFVTGAGGVKMSKSLGNVVDPRDIVREYGTDALRYYVARELHPFEDSSFTMEKFREGYNAHLANGLGNLVSRVMKMAASNGISFDAAAARGFAASGEAEVLHKKQIEGFEKYDIQQAADAVWDLITATDKIVQERQPFKKIKADRGGAEKDIKELLARLDMVGAMLEPIMPRTSRKILDLVERNLMPEEPLFMRK